MIVRTGTIHGGFTVGMTTVCRPALLRHLGGSAREKYERWEVSAVVRAVGLLLGLPGFLHSAVYLLCGCCLSMRTLLALSCSALALAALPLLYSLLLRRCRRWLCPQARSQQLVGLEEATLRAALSGSQERYHAAMADLIPGARGLYGRRHSTVLLSKAVRRIKTINEVGLTML